MQCHEAVFQGIFLYIPPGQHTEADGIALPGFGIPFEFVGFEPRMGGKHAHQIAVIVDRELEVKLMFLIVDDREIEPTD